MIIKRGEVYKFRVSRKETEGTEQQKNRPAVVISTNRLNKKNIRFVAIPITSKKLEKIYDFEVPVIVGGRRGKTLCDQIRVYNESRLNFRLLPIICRNNHMIFLQIILLVTAVLIR